MMWLSSPFATHDLRSAGRVAIEVDVGRGTTTVFISGELDLATMPFVSGQLTLVLQTRPERLVLDLTRTDFLDCGSARMIVATGRSLPAAGARSSVVRARRSGGFLSSPDLMISAR